jgi:hypothetical protein
MGVPRLREALAQAVAQGFVVESPRRHGEWMVYRLGERALRVNARRKDAPLRLLTMLRKAAA